MRLAPIALALLVALSGCNALGPTTEEAPEKPQVFRSVIVDNYDDEPHTVDVVVLHDGDIVYWTTRHLAARSNRTVDGAVVAPPEIENTTREYTVMVRLHDETTGVRYPPREKYQDDCYSVGVQIRDGELHVRQPTTGQNGTARHRRTPRPPQVPDYANHAA